MESDTRTRGESPETAAEVGSSAGVVEIPEDVAQALHRILNCLWEKDHLASSTVEARDALWYWFRTGRLRICRLDDADVLGVVEEYKLLRVVAGGVVQYAVEAEGGKRYYQSEEEDFQEMACHLKWYYLFFYEPEDPQAAGEPFFPELRRS
jgi:hypothetical protein